MKNHICTSQNGQKPLSQKTLNKGKATMEIIRTYACAKCGETFIETEYPNALANIFYVNKRK